MLRDMREELRSEKPASREMAAHASGQHHPALGERLGEPWDMGRDSMG